MPKLVRDQSTREGRQSLVYVVQLARWVRRCFSRAAFAELINEHYGFQVGTSWQVDRTENGGNFSSRYSTCRVEPGFILAIAPLTYNPYTTSPFTPQQLFMIAKGDRVIEFPECPVSLPDAIARYELGFRPAPLVLAQYCANAGLARGRWDALRRGEVPLEGELLSLSRILLNPVRQKAYPYPLTWLEQCWREQRKGETRLSHLGIPRSSVA